MHPSAKLSKHKHLIIGSGEVGKALYNVLRPHYNVSIRDVESGIRGHFDVLHLCFPPIKNFVSVAKSYMKLYNPSVVVVHSTVPVGTTQKLGVHAVHSPIRGIHPNLERGIKTFVKYFGGPRAKEAASYFDAIGIPVQAFKKSETTELLKILDTTYYGWNIMFAKEVKRICDERGLDFNEVYVVPNKDYNDAYEKIGIPYVARPVLYPKEGGIGGHCIIPNTLLLKDWLTDALRTRNKTYGSPAGHMTPSDWKALGEKIKKHKLKK